MTRRPVVTIDTRVSGPATPADRRALARALTDAAAWLHTAATFEGRVAIFEIERRCHALGAAHDAPDGTPAGYAAAALDDLAIVRGALAAGQADEAAAAALDLGWQLARAAERHRRDRSRPGGRAHKTDPDTLTERRATLARLTTRYTVSDELREQYPSLIAFLAARLQRTPRTIRRWLAAPR